MKFNDLKKRIPLLMRAGISVHFVSPPGRGKSDFSASIPAMMSALMGEPWGYASLSLTTATPCDLLGYLMAGVDAAGRRVAEFTLPAWARTVDPLTGRYDGKTVFDYKYGILHMDEFGQGQIDVKCASSDILLYKRAGAWCLNGGWNVIACSNRQSDRSGVTKSLDHTINRMMELHITDDVVSWTDWAVTHEVMPLTIAFANQNTNIVFADGVPEKQGPWCTPRSLCSADKLLREALVDGAIPLDDPSLTEMVGGLIGAGTASQYFGHVKLEQEIPPFVKVVADPKGIKVPVKPDLLMLSCYDLAHRVDRKTIGPVITYVNRMPKEYATTFASAACKRDSSLVTTPEIFKWCQENSSLMAAISR